MEINGFKIEKENQYNLQVNAKMSVCPLCSHTRKKNTEKCAKLNWENGLGHCFHCGEIFQLHTYEKKIIENKPFKRPFSDNTYNLSERLLKWFYERKISQKTLFNLKVSEGKEWMPQTNKSENCVKFNYFRDNELINIKYRDAKKNFKLVKDAEKIFYNLDNIRIAKECIIVEGEIDCLSFCEIGLYNCVSIPNGSVLKGQANLDYLDSAIDYFTNKEKIYLALDNDEAGRNTQKEIIRRLGADKCYIVDFLDCKDANEFLCKYDSNKLIKCILNAKITPLENVNSLNNLKNELHNYYENGATKGYLTGLNNFDSVFSVYTKQFIVVTGIPTHGKSDFVDQICCGWAVENNWKGAFCSVENDPQYLHLDKICRKISGIKPKSKADLYRDSWQLVENFVNDNFFFINYEDGYDLKKVLNKIAELVKRKGIKYFVLDPYNKIRLKESLKKDVNNYTSDYLVEIDTFCRKYDVVGIIVAHPVKQMKINGRATEPDFYSIKGGGEWFDMSPHGLLVWRDFDAEFVKVKILKCKFQNLGQNGAEIYFKWNNINGRYMQMQGNPENNFNGVPPFFDYSNLLLNKQNTENTKLDFENIESNFDFDNIHIIDEIPF